MLKDRLGRPLRDLRISVTDRCNFRCTYCMPKEIFDRHYRFLGRDKLLSFEEIARLARLFVRLGVHKIRLTGGEPLMRKELEQLIGMLAAIPGIDLSMTTNGSFPLQRVRTLKNAGLQRMTISLDALDNRVFQAMNDVDFSVERVLDWIDACGEVGFGAVKVNMVVKRGVNESEILPMARYFKGRGHILRFIEFMDVGHSNGWQLAQVVPAGEIVERVHADMPIVPAESNYRGEVAQRWRYLDGGGEIGVIASVTQAFCSDCSRMRLSADGSLYTCLFATRGHDLRSLLRDGATDETLLQAITAIWQKRTDRYSEIRSEATVPLHKIEMSYIGG